MKVNDEILRMLYMEWRRMSSSQRLKVRLHLGDQVLVVIV